MNDLLHYNDVPPNTVDEALLAILPIEGHLTFNGVVLQYRERIDWQVGKSTGEALVHDSLKRLEKAGRVFVGNHPNSPLFYKQLPCT